MREKLKGLVAGLLIGTTVAGGSVWAATGMRSIDVMFDNIKSI